MEVAGAGTVGLEPCRSGRDGAAPEVNDERLLDAFLFIEGDGGPCLVLSAGREALTGKGPV